MSLKQKQLLIDRAITMMMMMKMKITTEKIKTNSEIAKVAKTIRAITLRLKSQRAVEDQTIDLKFYDPTSLAYDVVQLLLDKYKYY